MHKVPQIPVCHAPSSRCITPWAPGISATALATPTLSCSLGWRLLLCHVGTRVTRRHLHVTRQAAGCGGRHGAPLVGCKKGAQQCRHHKHRSGGASCTTSAPAQCPAAMFHNMCSLQWHTYVMSTSTSPCTQSACHVVSTQPHPASLVVLLSALRRSCGVATYSALRAPTRPQYTSCVTGTPSWPASADSTSPPACSCSWVMGELERQHKRAGQVQG